MTPQQEHVQQQLQALQERSIRDLVCFGSAGVVVPHDGGLPRNATPEELSAALASQPEADASTHANGPTPGEGLTMERLRAAWALVERQEVTIPPLDLEPYGWNAALPTFRWEYLNLQRAPGEPEPMDYVREESKGSLLCETCYDAMTDRVLPADRSWTGLEMAQCAACAVEPSRG